MERPPEKVNYMRKNKSLHELEPKPPEVIANLAWLWLFGWRYKWYCFTGFLFVIGGFFVSQISGCEPDKLTFHKICNKMRETHLDQRPAVFVKSYLDRRIPSDAWEGIVEEEPKVVGTTSISDARSWSIGLTDPQETEGSIWLQTVQDASAIKVGTRIRYTGLIKSLQIDPLKGCVLSVVDGHFKVISSPEDDPQDLLIERLRQAEIEYSNYRDKFSKSVQEYANRDLDEIFEECIASVRDKPIGKYVKLLETTDVPDELIASAFADYLPSFEAIIFERFNADLMDELRALTSTPDYSPWMTRALKEWTAVEGVEYTLVEDAIRKLLEELPRWIKAYARRKKEPKNWHQGTTDNEENQRFQLLETLDRYTRFGLSKGRDQVLERVEDNFPSMSAIPVLRQGSNVTTHKAPKD